MTKPSTQNPYVSICVPTYNGAKFLRECLESIRAQTLGDFEVIIVDDDSSDDSFAIAGEFARNDDRFRIFHNAQRLGLTANWNQCVRLSRGTWIKILFQDDTLEPDCLKELTENCERYQCLFGFCSRHVWFDDRVSVETREFFTTHQAMVMKNFAGHMKAADFAGLCAAMPEMNPVGEPTVALFHRSVYERFGGFNPLLIQLCDAEYWMRVGSNVGIVHVPERLATFRVHSKSATAENFSRRSYHATVLDPLIIRYLFLWDGDYQTIRRILYQRSGRFSVWWRFIQHAYQAWIIARSRQAGTQDALAQWNQVASALPGLRNLAFVGLLVVPIQNVISKFGLSRFLNKHRRHRQTG